MQKVSRPYYPQAQAKVERVHRSLHSKMRYDLLKRKQGVNWALPNYTRILNEESASMSPFEENHGQCFYVCINNFLGYWLILFNKDFLQW